MKARRPAEISRLDECQVDPLLPALVPQGPGLGHAVGGDQVRDSSRACGAGAPARVRLPEAVQMNDVGRANRRLKVGFGAFERQPAGNGSRHPVATAWASRSSRHHAAGRELRSSPECLEPSRRRAPGRVHCRGAASRRALASKRGRRREQCEAAERVAESVACALVMVSSRIDSRRSTTAMRARSRTWASSRASSRTVGEPIGPPVRNGFRRSAGPWHCVRCRSSDDIHVNVSG